MHVTIPLIMDVPINKKAENGNCIILPKYSDEE
jgi:hypothetical protein